MTVRDTKAVVRINGKVPGAPHEAQWDSRIIDYVSRNPIGSLVAEGGGKIIGLVFGDIGGWEFERSEFTILEKGHVPNRSAGVLDSRQGHENPKMKEQSPRRYPHGLDDIEEICSPERRVEDPL